MKIKRWEDESDEEWFERLAEEIAIADNTKTSQYFIERDPLIEDGVIINYIGKNGWNWKEHPEGSFKVAQILEWKRKAKKWDQLAPMLPHLVGDFINNFLKNHIDKKSEFTTNSEEE